MLHGKTGLATEGGSLLPGRAPLAPACVASRRGWKDSSDRWHWSRPHLPGPQTKATRPHPLGCCPGFL